MSQEHLPMVGPLGDPIQTFLQVLGTISSETQVVGKQQTLELLAHAWDLDPFPSIHHIIDVNVE